MGTRKDGNSAHATLLHLRKLTGTQHTPFTFSHTTSATLPPTALGFMGGQHLATNSSPANCAGVTLPYIRAPIIVFNSFVNRAKHSSNSFDALRFWCGKTSVTCPCAYPVCYCHK